MLLIDLLVGLGIFLFGMMQLERSIETLGGSWIKHWLAKTTNNPAGSVLTGTVITAAMQSSSMVSLIVLAFASAGIIPLYNAIGVLLGANLGTTFTGWIVALLGFKLTLSTAALPTIGLGCLIQIFGDKRPKWRASGTLIFSFGLLLFGLGHMKEAVASLPEHFNLEQLSNLSELNYLLIGLLLTAIIQSSSATMIIALTALNAGIIDLSSAAALIIGADLGTTSTTALGGIKGFPIKRQLALAHFLFNLIVGILAFLFLLPVLPMLLRWIGLTDPIFSLVAFHSIFNVLGLCLFIPFLKPYSNWIGRRFLSGGKSAVSLEQIPISVPEAALSAGQQHVKSLLASTIAINLRNLRLDANSLSLSSAALEFLDNDIAGDQSFERRYETIKQNEGELLQFSARMQQQPLDAEQAKTLALLLDCSRDAVYSTKTLKDIRANLVELRHQLIPSLNHLSDQYQRDLKPFYQLILELLSCEHNTDYLREQVQRLNQLNARLHRKLHVEVIKHSDQPSIETEQLSTLLNINREILHSGQNLIHALEHWQQIDLPIPR